MRNIVFVSNECETKGTSLLQAQQQSAGFAQTNKPINLNFFCHRPKPDEAAETSWRKRLAPYYVELGLDPSAPIIPPPLRRPFDADMCDVVIELKAEIVSFLFGLPEAGNLMRRFPKFSKYGGRRMI